MRQLIYLRDVIRELVVRDIKLRYKRSLLGVGWSLLNPLLQFLVFYVVFTAIVPVSAPNYAVFLFTGILAWNWFSSSLNLGCSAITDNVALIRQPGFPSAILPVVTVTASLVNFLLALPILFVAAVVAGKALTTALIALPIVIAVQFLLTLSTVYVLAALHVSFRDTQYLLNIVLLLGFYLSPVFYNSDAVPATFQWVYRLNPVVHVLEAYRRILMEGRYPEFLNLGFVMIASLGFLVVSCAMFFRYSHWFVEEIGS